MMNFKMLGLALTLGATVGCTHTVGETIAQSLNVRYNDTRTACVGGLPAYYCNGVVLRGMEHPVDLYDLSEDERQRNTVAFSYVRADVGTIRLYNEGGFGGMIVNAFTDDSATPSTRLYPMKMRCAFSYDGATLVRPDGCGVSTQEGMNPPGSSRPCAIQGIVTPEQWGEHFASLENYDGKNRSCSFQVNAKDFQLSIDARHHFPDDSPTYPYRETWNEVVLAAWPREATPLLPIEAFFITSESALIFAQNAQSRFYKESNKIVPIVRLNLQAEQPFTYHDSDQAVLEQGNAQASITRVAPPN